MVVVVVVVVVVVAASYLFCAKVGCQWASIIFFIRSRSAVAVGSITRNQLDSPGFNWRETEDVDVMKRIWTLSGFYKVQTALANIGQ